MPESAALLLLLLVLLFLQRDFLDREEGRMPVNEQGVCVRSA